MEPERSPGPGTGCQAGQVDEAKARYDDVLRKTEAEVCSLLNEWRTCQDRLVRFRDELIPTMRQRTEAALTVYRTGKGDLPGALAARRDEIEVRMQALTLEMGKARSLNAARRRR